MKFWTAILLMVLAGSVKAVPAPGAHWSIIVDGLQRLFDDDPTTSESITPAWEYVDIVTGIDDTAIINPYPPSRIPDPTEYADDWCGTKSGLCMNFQFIGVQAGPQLMTTNAACVRIGINLVDILGAPVQATPLLGYNRQAGIDFIVIAARTSFRLDPVSELCSSNRDAPSLPPYSSREIILAVPPQ